MLQDAIIAGGKSAKAMTIFYHSHESLLARVTGTVLPRVYKLMIFTGLISLFLAYRYDGHRKSVPVSSTRLLIRALAEHAYDLHQVKGGQEKTFEMYLFHDAEAFFGMATTFGASLPA